MGWSQKIIGDVCHQPQYGYTTKATQDGDLHLLRTTDITSGSIDWSTVPFCTENPEDEDKYLLNDGDIVISRAGSVGVSYLIKSPKNAVFASYLIRFKPLIDKQYFKYFLDGPFYWNAITENKLGIAVPNVNANKLKEISIPIPPENEQHRIVDKIEELFSELDKGIESLKTAREQLKVYRQALLKHAFEGKLTEQWRKDNADKLETADHLLERIKQEREARYQQQLEDWKAAVKQWEADGKEGKKPAKPKMPKALGDFSPDELADFSLLPAGWEWVKFDKICEHDQYAIKAGPFGSALKKEHYSETGYKVYGQEQVISGDPYLGDYYVPEKKYQELITCKIKPQDILISLVGTVGKVLVLPEDCAEGIINPRLIKVSANTECYLPEFFKYYFESMYLKSLYKLQTHGATMDVLNLGIIQSLPFPFCSIEEQQDIVRKLDSALSVIEQYDAEIESSVRQSEALRQSILKKAFSGQLVPQDPDDEPASALLDRIAKEKEEAVAKAKKAKAAKKKQVTRKAS